MQAILARADAIVPWNSRRLVNSSRMHALCGVNVPNGYRMVLMVTPSPISATWEASNE